jgi:hypothetical protein
MATGWQLGRERARRFPQKTVSERWQRRASAIGLPVICSLLLILAPATTQAGVAQQYLPFEVGNSWTFVGDDESVKQFSVIATQELHGHSYFLLDDWFSPCCFPGYSDEVGILLRYDTDADQVLQYDPQGEEELVRYDFSGSPWGACGNQRTRTDMTVIVPAGQFEDGVGFEYATDVRCGVFHETLAPGVGPVAFYSSWDGNFQLEGFTIVTEPGIVGDYNRNGELDAGDLDLQALEMQKPVQEQDLAEYDLNNSGAVDFDDRRLWVEDLKNTWMGDANLDFEFNSSDMVQVFVAGKYETEKQAGWEEGDWNGTLFFDSSDFVATFGSCYDRKGCGPRPRGPTAARAVPEPGGCVLLVLGVVTLLTTGRRS